MRVPRIIMHPSIPGVELVMGIGATEPLRFALEWKVKPGDMKIETVLCDIPLYSSREQTLYDVDKSEANSFAVRLYLEEQKRPRINWIPTSILGKGSFGSVVSGLDYHHGNWYAVKQIEGFNLEDGYPKEYKIIKRINHVGNMPALLSIVNRLLGSHPLCFSLPGGTVWLCNIFTYTRWNA